MKSLFNSRREKTKTNVAKCKAIGKKNELDGMHFTLKYAQPK